MIPQIQKFISQALYGKKNLAQKQRFDLTRFSLETHVWSKIAHRKTIEKFALDLKIIGKKFSVKKSVQSGTFRINIKNIHLILI